MTDTPSSHPLYRPPTRREFIRTTATLGLCSVLWGCEFVEIFDLDVAEHAHFDISSQDFSALQSIGGTACIQAGALELLLVRAGEDQVLAYDRYCPHDSLDMGSCGSNPLPAQWDTENNQLVCRWHRSIFDVDGSVLSGPSPRPIRVYPVEFSPESGQGTVFVERTGSTQ